MSWSAVWMDWLISFRRTPFWRSGMLLNSLWPSDAIWRHWTWSTLVQVMAWCLMAPSHYLNQCWLIISEVLWHSPERNFTENAPDIYPWYGLENHQFQITAMGWAGMGGGVGGGSHGVGWDGGWSWGRGGGGGGGGGKLTLLALRLEYLSRIGSISCLEMTWALFQYKRCHLISIGNPIVEMRWS